MKYNYTILTKASKFGLTLGVIATTGTLIENQIPPISEDIFLNLPGTSKKAVILEEKVIQKVVSEEQLIPKKSITSRFRKLLVMFNHNISLYLMITFNDVLIRHIILFQILVF